MNKLSALTIILSVSLFSGLYAQLPNTGVFAFEYSFKGTNFELQKPQFLTEFNANGYNNQPCFISDTEILISSDGFEKGSNDILKIDIKNRELLRFTETPESEYSPTKVPNKALISCVRVEQDQTTQLLWAYPENRKDYGGPLLPEITNVGYHAWITDKLLALFLVGEPHQLAIINIETKRKQILLDNIGRCMKVDNKGNLLFVHKIDATNWFIKSYNPKSNTLKSIIQTPEGAEDFEILKDGSLIIGHGSKLSGYDPRFSKTWKHLADLASYGVNKITRVATRKNNLVLVSSEQ